MIYDHSDLQPSELNVHRLICMDSMFKLNFGSFNPYDGPLFYEVWLHVSEYLHFELLSLKLKFCCININSILVAQLSVSVLVVP